jgi:hypothetical protein
MKIKCFYANGDTILTRFIGSRKQAREYFIGRVFNIGVVEDNLQTCVNIVILKEGK